MITSFSELSALQKEELVASLACLLAGKAEDEMTAEKLVAIASASGNTLSEGLASLFSKTVSGAKKIDDLMPGVGGGGGGGGGGGAAAGGGAAEAAEEEPEEEEMAAPAMDMFGGGDGGGGDY